MAAKVKFEQRNVRGETYTAVVFAGVFSCKVLSNENGVLNVEHFETRVSPFDVIYIVCRYFADLEKNHGVREVKISLNKVDLTITSENAESPVDLFLYWRGKAA